MANKELNEWTTQDVTSWIMTLPGGQALKQKAVDAIVSNEIAGADLFNITEKSALKDINVPGLFATKLWSAIQSLKESRNEGQQPNENHNNNDNNNNRNNNRNNRNNNNNNNNNNNHNNSRRQRQMRAITTEARVAELLALEQQEREARDNNGSSNGILGRLSMIFHNSKTVYMNDESKSDSSFRVPIIIGQTQKKTRAYFEPGATVRELRQHIADTEGGDPDHLNLICKGKQLQDIKTLKECGITKQVHNYVVITFKVKGGSSLTDEKMNNDNIMMNNNDLNANIRKRIPDFKNKNIKATLDADCIMGTDDQDCLRVQMPCGHVFEPLTIFKIAQRTLQIHGKTDVQCPILECKKIWEIGDIISGADLDKREQGNLASVLENRRLLKGGNYKQCPGCEALVEKPDKLYMLRVHCNSKQCNKKPDFCWICAQSWKGGGFAVCGNADCHTAIVNEELKIANCGTTTAVLSRNDVQCPKMRACPRCLALVGYKEACKHMKCWSCNEFFCFICLSLGHKNPDKPDQVKKWDCQYGDSHAGQCKLAPVQVIK